MFKGWKHACQCTKCKTIVFMDNVSPAKALDDALNMEKTKKSDCCQTAYEYIGLWPEHENILITPEPAALETLVVIEESHKSYGEKGTVEIFKPVIKQLDKAETEDEPASVKTKSIKLEDVIDINRKISGRYMTDIVRGVLEENNEQTEDKINMLKTKYPDFFQDALKYVPKFLKSKYNLA